jgi:hypothetical protein
MSTTKTKTKEKAVPQKLQACRDAFDYMIKMSMERIQKGGSVEGEFVATVFLPNETSLTVIPVPLANTVDADQRREIMRLTGEDIAEQKADAFVFMFIAEAWASVQKRSGNYIRPINDPKRKEVFLASAQDKTGCVRNVSYEIKRKTTGVEFAKIDLFGKSQKKFSHTWTNPKDDDRLKIQNSLTEEAWTAYKKKLKEIK